MSIVCDLFETPQDFLDLVKKHPEAILLYHNAFSNKEELTISNLKKLSQKQKEITKKLYALYPDLADRIKQTWSINDCQSILNFKQYQYDDCLRVYIPKIIEYGKKCDRLYLDCNWRIVSYLFNSCNRGHNELITWNQSCLGINVFLYYKNFLDSLEMYYFTVDEVQELAELIQDFADEIITENIKQITNRNTSIEWVIDSSYSNWRNESYLVYARDICNSVKNFYYEVAERGNCVIVSIG